MANVDVNRLSQKDGGAITSYVSEIRVQCADCRQPFKFICPDVGMMTDRPCISPDGQELRVYLEPSDGSLDPLLRPPGFSIKHIKADGSNN
jgi:hypothetical protein